MKKILVILMLCISAISFSQLTYNHRGIIRMVYSADTLDMSFDTDSVIFDGTSEYYIFDGGIVSDEIESPYANLDSADVDTITVNQLEIGDSTITVIYQGVIPDTVKVRSMINDGSGTDYISFSDTAATIATQYDLTLIDVFNRDSIADYNSDSGVVSMSDTVTTIATKSDLQGLQVDSLKIGTTWIYEMSGIITNANLTNGDSLEIIGAYGDSTVIFVQKYSILFKYTAPAFTGSTDAKFYIGYANVETISSSVFVRGTDYLDAGSFNEIHTATPTSYIKNSLYLKLAAYGGGGGGWGLFKIQYYLLDFKR